MLYWEGWCVSTQFFHDRFEISFRRSEIDTDVDMPRITFINFPDIEIEMKLDPQARRTRACEYLRTVYMCVCVCVVRKM